MFGFLRGKTKTQKNDTEISSEVSHAAELENEDPKKSLNEALSKTRQGFFSRIKGIFSFKPQIDEETLLEMEEILVSADIGIKTASELIDSVRQELKRGVIIDETLFKEILKGKIKEILFEKNPDFYTKRLSDGPTVILIIGVNGVGKTTTIGKVANFLKQKGVKVALAAADTFRAAAVEQLSMWGDRVGIEVIKGPAGAKPSGVVFDAVSKSVKNDTECLIIDTAGRLHNKQNLMSELEGIKNSIIKNQPSAPHEVWLVIDGATGQNAIIQAKEFNQICKLTGVIVTKLDGTPKGGVVIAIKRELDVPIRFIGVGEGLNDLKPFSADEFIEALFDDNDAYTLSAETAISANAKIRRERRG
ncbi:MAG: signal recognition particle-docking protein FtsY [bacterium]|nr:signal recognition particle-docking protein FtsY [bacterium]